jgi:hypothetical protein
MTVKLTDDQWQKILQVLKTCSQIRLGAGRDARRFWSELKVFEKLFEHFSQDRDMEYLMLDSTIVRAHACAAGAQKKRAHKV